MKINRYNSMHAALEHGTENTWAVIDIRMRHPEDSYTPDDQCLGLTSRSWPAGAVYHNRLGASKANQKFNRPQLTLRMHPIAIPDTRSYR